MKESKRYVTATDVAQRAGASEAIAAAVIGIIDSWIDVALRMDAIFYCRLGPIYRDKDDSLALAVQEVHERAGYLDDIDEELFDRRDLFTRDDVRSDAVDDIGCDDKTFDRVWGAYFDLVREADRRGERTTWVLARDVSERLFEDWLEQNLDQLDPWGYDLEPCDFPELGLRTRQGRLPNGKIYDLLLRDRSTGDIVVIENKVIAADAAVYDQIVGYIEQLAQLPALKGEQVRGLVVCDGTLESFRAKARADERVDWALLLGLEGYQDFLDSAAITSAEDRETHYLRTLRT